ncbi:hypothetical protein L6164_005606 [Bauhinia variegata]|uniref:Uncharacterized protein n=1 Tax=Bauhinia variegata TaxID=167791 RepID=A0ACB9PTP5_BAUVA|nr:hypothetical protein L6164_005606 [Bauhinia variegata]
MMQKLGFADQWVNTIMQGVTSVSYSVLINDKPQGIIIPKRELRQGDPLNPYLLLICAEGLSALLFEAEAHQILEGVQVSSDAPSISHLFFADVSLLSSTASITASLELNIS